ncbi:MAG TPA: glycosyl hydrolase family 18 protein [Pyrinomonadaceae bacterium]|nr:glycosyl hydrolase family 18 protein [Pyrinomonadaceae bacterium]
MTTTASEKFVVYWLGYHSNPPAIQSLPKGIDVVNLFLLNLTSTSTGATTLDYNFITSNGTTWATILDQSHAAQADGMKVCVSIIPPNNSLIWNTIPDPDTFAENVYNLVKSWGFNGIDIDPEQGPEGSTPPDQNFVTVVQALSKYFGPAANTGLTMSYVGFQLFNDEIVLKPCASLFNYVMLMGYWWDTQEMEDQFNQYAAIVGSQNLMFGIGGDPWQTPLSVTQALAPWEPAKGNKGGMMEFNINDDTNYQAANAIIKALSSQALVADQAN